MSTIVTRLSGLSIRTKILSVVALFAVAGLISGLVAISTMRSLAANTAELATVQAEVEAPLQTVHQGQLKARMIIAQVAAAPSDEEKEAWVADQVDNDAEVADAIARFEASAGELTPASWETFRTGWAKWQSVRDTGLVPAALEDDRETFEQSMSIIVKHRTDIDLVAERVGMKLAAPTQAG